MSNNFLEEHSDDLRGMLPLSGEGLNQFVKIFSETSKFLSPHWVAYG